MAEGLSLCQSRYQHSAISFFDLGQPLSVDG
jgi:hypothetical protein